MHTRASTLRVMDALAGLLDGPRARGAFVLRSVLTAPWSIRVEDQAPLTVVAMVRGAAWFLGDGKAPTGLASGDIAIVRGPDPYTVADDPATPVGIVIHPGQRCTTVDGCEVPLPNGLGVRTWGNDPGGETMMLTGTYHLPGEISGRVLAALPTLVVLRQDEWDSHLVGLLRDEIGRDSPGQEAVLDRLQDLLLITALRSWFSRAEANTPGWFLAQNDPVVGSVLRLLQEHQPTHGPFAPSRPRPTSPERDWLADSRTSSGSHR